MRWGFSVCRRCYFGVLALVTPALHQPVYFQAFMTLTIHYQPIGWQHDRTDLSQSVQLLICGQWAENGKSIDKYALICCPLYTPLNCNVTCYFSLSLLLLCINVHQMQMSHKTWFISIGAISLYFEVCRLNSLLTNEQMVLAERTIWDVKPSLIISSGLVWFF